MSNRRPISSKKKMILLFFILGAGSGIAILLATIRVVWVNGDKWRAKAEERSKDYVKLPAHRGDIYSSDGKLMVTTLPTCDLFLDFSIRPLRKENGEFKLDSAGNKIYYTPIPDTAFQKHLDSVCIMLHHSFPDSSVDFFREKLINLRNHNHGGCIPIIKDMQKEDWDKICSFSCWARGVVKYIGDESVIHGKRFHTYGNLAHSVIGFGPYKKAAFRYSGLEGYYDSTLKGLDGLVLRRRLTRRSWIAVNKTANLSVSESDSLMTDSIPSHPVIDGSDIVATIDTRIQDIAHYSLGTTLQKLRGTAGCAILIEVETGNVLACASLVQNTKGEFVESPNRNVPLTDLYEPGSVFKPVILTAMYNDPMVSLDTSMLLPVGVKKFSKHCATVADHDTTVKGFLPLWKAVAISSNVAFCELAWRYYNDRRSALLNRVIDIFPFNKIKPDIVGPEYDGRKNPLNNDSDFLRFCYGYTCNVSPLRMATFYNALANKGKMVKPRFCKAIIKNGVVRELPTQVLNEQICSANTAETLRDLLIGVVDGGTGDNLKTDTYSIAGKTGTSETSPGAPTSNVTFVGFFPADKPKYTCLVLMRDVKERFGRDAAPVFQDIADCIVSLDKDLDCRPTIKHLTETRKKQGLDKHYNYLLPTVSKAPQAEVRWNQRLLGIPNGDITHNTMWCIFREPIDSLNIEAAYIDYRPSRGVVPNCYGMTIKDALLLCRSLGVDVCFEGCGKVVSQEPKPRTKITKGMKVRLKLK